MRTIEAVEAGVHCQKSELRNQYSRVFKIIDKEDKLFIDDRKSGSVAAVMLSYRFYRQIVKALNEIEALQDEADYQTAIARSNENVKPLSAEKVQKLLKK